MIPFFHNNMLLWRRHDRQELLRIISTLPCGTLFAIALRPDLSEGGDRKLGHLRHRYRTISKEELEALEAAGELKLVELEVPPWAKHRPDDLSAAQRHQWAQRKMLMAPFLRPKDCAAIFAEPGGLARTIRRQVMTYGCTEVVMYRLLQQLINFGFDELSLLPRFQYCGAPGKRRPWSPTGKKAGRRPVTVKLGLLEVDPQTGLTREVRDKLVAVIMAFDRKKKTFTNLYDHCIEVVYVNKYRVDDKGLSTPVLPPIGTYANRRQVRHLWETALSKLDQLRLGASRLHFESNLRGQRGVSYEGFDGPGSCYIIDSTVGDIFLRHSVNRNWIIGRPIVYILVCAWSTAIVGFYVCLNGPSWREVKIALFSTFAAPDIVAQLRGCSHSLGLDPAPGIPHQLLCDRGEYLSGPALETADQLGFDLIYTASYRADLKGLVEVLHRIAKDEQFRFIPGAIDRRRKDLELRQIDIRESVLTLPEYVQYLQSLFAHYNLTADRRNRLTLHMIGQDVPPTPAGLWQFGHLARYGYGGKKPHELLIERLLPQVEGAITRRGIRLERLLFESERVNEDQLTTLARHQGAIGIKAHYYPGSTNQVWWRAQSGESFTELTLSPSAIAMPDMYFDEVVDALAYDLQRQPGREHDKLAARLQQLAQTNALIKEATRRTRAAETADTERAPPTRQARATDPAARESWAGTSPERAQQDDASSADELYDSVMQAALLDRGQIGDQHAA